LLQCSSDALTRLFATTEIIDRSLQQTPGPIRHIFLSEYRKLVQTFGQGLPG
jgi:hypothetical protein